MLTVTTAALQQLKAALVNREAIEQSCFRFTRHGESSLGLIIEEPEASDKVFDCDGETVLAMPEPLQDVLSKTVLDVDDDGQLVLLPKAA
jgi:hypothetical protein